jgi:hypothetical protein
MKKISKNFIIKSIRYAIDFILILQFVVIIGTVFSIVRQSVKSQSEIVANKETDHATISSPFNNIMIALSNPDLGKYLDTIDKKMALFWNLCRLVNVILLTLITVQFRYIFRSFSPEDYFNQSNPERIKRIAIIIFIWVLADSALRYIPGIIIPDYLIYSSIGLNSLHHGNSYGIIGINTKMLTVSLIIYMLSIVFKYGNSLKEESSLTI